MREKNLVPWLFALGYCGALSAFGGINGMGVYLPVKISAHQAARIVKEKIPGKIHSVALEAVGGRFLYSVTIGGSTPGLREIFVDACSGKILPPHFANIREAEKRDSGRNHAKLRISP